MDQRPVASKAETSRSTLSWDELRVRLEAPQTLDEFAGLLDELERELRCPFGFQEQAGSIIPALISKLRLYTLILSAQHLLIRDLARIVSGARTVQ